MTHSPTATNYLRTSWFFKFSECTLAVIGILSVLLLPLELLPPSFWAKYGDMERYLFPGMGLLALLTGIGYSIVWHRRERAGRVDSGLRHAWLQAFIRYWLAFEISTYGFAKILKTQFDTPAYRYDMPVSDMSGFQLTWFYYGYSYPLAVIIALFQIGGSVLLLFRRTTLLGVMILLPVMVNIMFINVFYNIGVGAFFNSVVFTLGLLLFLFIDLDKLKRAFWNLVERLPPVRLGRRAWLKNGIRVLTIVLAFSFIYALQLDNNHDEILSGAWKVEKLTRNGRVVSANAWLTDTTAWNRVYFAGWQGVAFSPNPYRYKPKESLRGSYDFDSTKNALRLMMYASAKAKTPDTIQATISHRTRTHIQLSGIIRHDTLTMQLARLR